MSDLDAELRRLASAIATDAPPAPEYEDLALLVGEPDSRSPRRRWPAVAVAAVVVALVIATVVIVANLGGSTRQEPLGPSPFVPCAAPDPGNFVGPNGKTFGPVPNTHPEGGTITPEDIAAMPDYIPVTCRSGTGIGGWIKKTDMLSSPSPVRPDQAQNAPPDIDPVFADDGTTIVGHMVDGKGFVPLGEKP